jgi:nicotine blue oxidoreductase
MGTPKAQLRIDGVRLIDRAVSVLAGAGCSQVVAVTRVGLDVVGAHCVVNVDPDRGMRSSLALAVSAAAEFGADVMVVILVDTPGITAEDVRTVIQAWQPGRIAVGSYGGRPGHPTVLAMPDWRRAIALAEANEGARALLRTDRHRVDEVPVGGSIIDLDTPEDLAAWGRLATRMANSQTASP